MLVPIYVEELGDLVPKLGGVLAILGFNAIFVLAGSWLMWRGKITEKERNEFVEGHSAVEGRVLNRYEQAHHGDRGDTYTYHVTVHFETNEGLFELDANVAKSLFNSVSEGQTISVRYADSDPTIAMLEGEW